MSTHKVLFAGALIAASVGILGFSASPAQACDSSPYMGTVCWMAGTYCPEGTYLPADGRLVAINDYQALFSLYAVTYGGDGRVNFALPDLRGRAIVGTGQPRPITPSSPYSPALGNKVGNEQITLTQSMLPTHTHQATFTGQSSSVNIQPKIQVVATTPTPATSLAPSTDTPYLAGIVPIGMSAKKMWAPSAGTTPVNVGVGATLTVTATPALSGGNKVANSTEGGSYPVPTISPEVVMTACVAIKGTYPQRNN